MVGDRTLSTSGLRCCFSLELRPAPRRKRPRVSHLEQEPITQEITQELSRSQYWVLGLVGQGQFGRVYCASHRQTGNIVALKELDKRRFPTHEFLREMQFLLSLAHANIVSLYALEQTQTGRYMVMDYCEGGTLRSLIQEDMRLHAAQALRVVADILSGLEHAHSRGVIHCDIKPENILLRLTPEGWTAKISDFGIARLGQEIKTQDMQLGSPAYMAPERFQGEYSYASDLYAVGIVLFELLTGYRPFAGRPADLRLAHMNQAVTLPKDMPTDLQLLIQRSLQKLPAQRFRSAAVMREAVQAAAANLGDLSRNNLSQRTPRALLYPTEPLIPGGFQAVSVQPLPSPIRQVIVATAPDAVSSGLPRSRPQAPLYLVFDRHIQRWHSPQSALLPDQLSQYRQSGRASKSIEDWHRTQVLFPAPIQAISLTMKGAVVIANRRLYHVQSDQFVPCSGNWACSGDWADNGGRDLCPEAIAQFSQEVVMATDPQGRWLATATQGQTTPLQMGWIRDRTIRLQATASAVRAPQQLIALDSRYLVAVGSGPNAPDPPLLQVINRRGICVAHQSLPVKLQGMISTPRPYRLLALEPDHTNSVLLLDLKPFRMQRIGVGITPKLLTATPWGYIVMAENGQIVVLNQQGQIMGCSAGPASPTAIAPIALYGLAIATWQNGAGNLHIVDLRQLDLDMVF